MPRADPTRSDYCASRHLLRNLDSAAELRRNPLVRDYFRDVAGNPRRRDAAADRLALERIRYDVRASLARCSEFARDRTHTALGRMHAVLLRCEIDDRPPVSVAAEIGLSERQLRRERSAAHDAFARAFRAPHRQPRPSATACDVATVRLAEAVELHELGQGVLAQSAFESIATGASSPARKIEALCLAAEAEFDALRHAAAATYLADARTILARDAHELDDEAARSADEHLDLVAWLLRWQTAVSSGLATQPPIALVRAHDDRAREESRRALFVRAAASYATQRWEVGDGGRGQTAVQRAWTVMPTLYAHRTKERLCLMMADAQLYGFRAPRGADRYRFRVVERLAASHGHVHAALTARAERIAGAAVAGPDAAGRIFDRIMQPFGAVERRGMARARAWAAQVVTQCESNPCHAIMSAKLAESVLPPRSASAMMARCRRAAVAIDAHCLDDAASLLQSIYDDADLAGNGRVRATAARSLATIALGRRRRSEAQCYIRQALALAERFGSPEALARTTAIARKLNVA
jgi:hypothetical protein